MSRGTINGLASEQGWQLFTPGTGTMLVLSDSGGSATPSDLADSTVVARYRYDRQLGRVSYQGNIQFGANFQVGSGAFGYNLLMPYPCARDLGGADLMIGSGYMWQGTFGSKFMPLRIVQSDAEYPIGTAADTTFDEDHYMQFFNERNVVQGTGSIPSGSTSATVNFASVGGGTNGVVDVFDVIITPTNNPTTNPVYWWITSLGASSFVINCKTNPSTSGFNFSWKISSESLLVRNARPFGLNNNVAAGCVLGWSVEYQARR